MNRRLWLGVFPPTALFANISPLEMSSLFGIATTLSLGLSGYLLYRNRQLRQERDTLQKSQQAESNIIYLQSRYASMGETLANIAHQWKQPLNAIGAIQNNIKLI